MFAHEDVHVVTGARSGLPIVQAIHSTALGPAVGGCRVWSYPDWRDGLEDALRLSAGMTGKCAVAGLANGGGKTVVALPPGTVLDADRRRAMLLDVGDAVDARGGRYATGPDVGTGPADMAVIGERTTGVFCRPDASGDSSPATATGVMAALRATSEYLGLESPSFAVVGLGHVGADLARRLAATGARLVVSDVVPDARKLADELGAEWVAPEAALTAEAEILVPSALGGVLTAELVDRLRCRAVVGPANNQLATADVADLLHARGILWAPDYVASAGGIVHAIATELYGEPPATVAARIEQIGTTLGELYRADGLTPAAAAEQLVAARLKR
jgi:leucine dehydrogenase